jgi:hypothetical protein
MRRPPSPADTARVQTLSAAERRHRYDVMLWAAGVAWLGALAVVPAAVVLDMGLQFVLVFAAVFSPGLAGADTSGWVLTLAVTTMATCLLAALACAWVLSGRPGSVAPAWLVGGGSGLLGWGAGAAVAWLALSY